MDISTVLGLILASVFLFLAIADDINAFIDLDSVFIVVGGTLGACLISFSLSDVLSMFSVTKNAFFAKSRDQGQIINSMVDLGEKARREGILALEREMPRIDDIFLKKALQLAVDGNEPEVIETVMGTEIDNVDERHKIGKSFWETVGSMSPAWGMVGTLIGLIMMLKELDDPSAIGVGMAVALITTLYGSVIANLVAIPLSNKLDRRSKEELLLMNMVLFGVLSIHSGDNPRVTREKLETFVAPKNRKASS
ncbi:MAG: MotA/TolQ/ExbB proton channel family protein [Candidatus Cloacimonetes bacterium]|nr:MotA/TolQ/ExbB proton channel family protein [Candidatus Cloacimonadota bacterium]